MPGKVDIRRVYDPNNSQAARLVAESDAYLSPLYPPESNYAEPFESLIQRDCAFFMAVIDAEAVACGAVRTFQGRDRYGELKRLFVRDRFRGRGLATLLVDRLEDFLREDDISLARLEAGPMQPEALNLYRKLGYRSCAPFGSYPNDPMSVFMEKYL